MRSLYGPLFPEETSAPLKGDQLAVLLEPVGYRCDERRELRDKQRDQAGIRPIPAAVTNLAGTASSADSASPLSLSRTDSWTSYLSTSTLVTSPSNSPDCNKSLLPGLHTGKRVVPWSARSRRASKLVTVPLAETPLSSASRSEKRDMGSPRNNSLDRLSGKSLVARVRLSVRSVVDLVTRAQSSYLRTVQFSLPSVAPSAPKGKSSPSSNRLPSRYLKVAGARASVSDVQVFVPKPERISFRLLHLASESNIPLPKMEIEPEVNPSVSFGPNGLAARCSFGKRSRFLTEPEWRLRPVYNPVALRLRAVANTLHKRGIAWEGYAQEGTLGYGHFKVYGIAYEGLGASRLAFES